MQREPVAVTARSVTSVTALERHLPCGCAVKPWEDPRFMRCVSHPEGGHPPSGARSNPRTLSSGFREKNPEVVT